MPWRQQLTNNIGWKIFSLLIATYIWFTVHNQLDVRKIENNPLFPSKDKKPTYVVSFRPIRVMVPPGKEGQFRIKEKEVEVILQRDSDGPGGLELSSRDVHAFVDLTDFWSSDRSAPTNPISREVLIQAPPHYTAVKVNPKTVVVEPVIPSEK